MICNSLCRDRRTGASRGYHVSILLVRGRRPFPCGGRRGPARLARAAEDAAERRPAADAGRHRRHRRAGASELESPKATAELLDTPQTVTVISDQVIRQQNLLTLRDALATVPGITFGAGEGGGGYGDSINLRGYSANNDITVDGVRDSAQYSRTDPFNLAADRGLQRRQFGLSTARARSAARSTSSPSARRRTDLTIVTAGSRHRRLLSRHGRRQSARRRR